jgi:hypothetical protein
VKQDICKFTKFFRKFVNLLVWQIDCNIYVIFTLAALVGWFTRSFCVREVKGLNRTSISFIYVLLIFRCSKSVLYFIFIIVIFFSFCFETIDSIMMFLAIVLLLHWFKTCINNLLLHDIYCDYVPWIYESFGHVFVFQTYML